MQAKTPEKNQPSIKKPQPSITKPVKHRAPNKQIATPTEVTAVHPVAKQPAKRPVEKAIPVGQPLTESFRATEENHSRQETIVSSPSTQSAPLLSLPVSLDQLTTIPAFTQPFQPEYPIQMRRMGREGVVEVALLIDQRGKIVETNIIKSAGSAFDKAALDALQKVAFTPGKVNEKQVSVRLNLPIRFVLH
jgi:TonB family protein